MNSKQFEHWMHAVDDDLLEEAQEPYACSHRRHWTGVALAACLCLLLVGGYMLRTGKPASPAEQHTQSLSDPIQDAAESNSTLVNPLREVTEDEVAALGYEMPLPADATDVTYTVIDGGTGDAPLVEVTFTQDSACYTCRALKAEAPEDISGIYAEWTESLDWTVDDLTMQLREADSGTAWVSWYAPAQETQWCLNGEGDGLSLLHTAQAIVEALGYQMTVAPPKAENVVYNAFSLDGLTVGETVFRLDGVACSFRTAATWEIGEDFADISQAEGPFDQNETTELQWCQAKLSWNEGGEGKIIWFDMVPGLLYSLHMEQNASREALLDLAGQLFVPAQGEVG